MMKITKEAKKLTFLESGKEGEREREGERYAVKRRFQMKLSVTPIVLHKNSFCCYIFQHDNAIL